MATRLSENKRVHKKNNSDACAFSSFVDFIAFFYKTEHQMFLVF